MAILQLHSLRIQNNSTKFTCVAATRASSSLNQSVSTPKSNDFSRLVFKLKSNSLSFALSGTLALSVALSGIYRSLFYVFLVDVWDSLFCH
ncbi:hypothetical protein HanPI659440_Chr13g0489261 [Helianthus annuus]|nr:hypothetical protein HanPI659440_Chr13g0489261 [Helianthus annuus]